MTIETKPTLAGLFFDWGFTFSDSRQRASGIFFDHLINELKHI
jgi:hypothetical protein